MANSGKFRRLQCEQACKEMANDVLLKPSDITIEIDKENGNIHFEWAKPYGIRMMLIDYHIGDQLHNARMVPTNYLPENRMFEADRGIFDDEDITSVGYYGEGEDTNCYIDVQLNNPIGQVDIKDMKIAYLEAYPVVGLYEM